MDNLTYDNPVFDDEVDTELDAELNKVLDETYDKIEMEKRIKELETQVEQYKKTTEQPQHVVIEETSPVTTTAGKKRSYKISEENAKMRAFVKDHIKDNNYIDDLINGVGLKDIIKSEIPRSLLRAYITLRYQQDNKK